MAACRTAPEIEAPALEAPNLTPPPPYTLGAGDLIHVTVAGAPEIRLPETGVAIDANGDIDIPYVGVVHLGDATLPQARERLKREVGRVISEPLVSLNVLEYRSRTYTVLGQVTRPGPYPLTRPTTALASLSAAGGFSAFADRSRVALLRIRGEELQVHFFDGDTPDVGGYIQVHPDDLIFVRQTGAGAFRDQLQPIVQGIVGPLSVLSSLIVVSDSLSN